MTLEELKKCKKAKGYTYARMSELSGIPLGTIQKIFSGETVNPRYDTMQALENLFDDTGSMVVREAATYMVYTQGNYTVDDYFALPDEQRVELIDGYFYDMASPTGLHQLIGGEIHRQIANFIMDKGGDCIPFIAPLDVQLDCDEKTMVQPDVIILCDEDKLKNGRIFGAPDFLLEVISPSTKKKDFTIKVHKYMNAGVREYWIINPYSKQLFVFGFENEDCPIIYNLNSPVPIGIYNGELEISFKHISKWIEKYS